MKPISQLDSAGFGALLGSRLRECRSDLGMTLTELARVADLSPGYLSTIENGASIPSLPVLARLAHALDVSLAEILRASSSPRVARGAIDAGTDTRVLATNGSQLEIVRQSALAGEVGEAPVTLGQGDVFIYLCQGTLVVVVDNDAFELAPGDALHGDRPRRITWRAVGSERVVALWASAVGASRPSAR